MDFAYSDQQRSVLDLAKQILSDGATGERMSALEKSDGPRFDPQLWKELATAGLLEGVFEDTRRWAAETALPDGRRVIDQEWVQVNLARVFSGLEFVRLLNWKVAWCSTQGKLDVADASSIKVFGTEWYLESFRLLMEVLGARGYLKRGSPEAAVQGHLETLYRGLLILTFGGGTNEIQRDLIGMFGLGLPRAPRF